MRVWLALVWPALLTGCVDLSDLRPASVQLPPGGLRVPLDLDVHKPFIEVHVNGRGPFRFLLDTGAACTCVSAEVVKRADLATFETPFFQFSTPSGQTRGSTKWARIGELRIGKAVFRDFQASVKENLSGPAGEEGTLGFDGILGVNLFTEHLLTVDYPGKEMVLAPGRLGEPDGKDRLQFQLGCGIPHVPLAICGVTVWTVVDSGSDLAFSLPRQMKDKVRFITGPVPLTAATVNGTTTCNLGRTADPIAVGRHEFTEPVVDVGTAMPIMGGMALKYFRLTLDLRGGIVQFERPAATAIRIPPTWRSFGVSFAFDPAKKRWLVREIAPDSSAEKSGVRKGDLLVSVNGVQAADLRREYWNWLGGHSDLIRLALLRDGRRIDVEVPVELFP